MININNIVKLVFLSFFLVACGGGGLSPVPIVDEDESNAENHNTEELDVNKPIITLNGNMSIRIHRENDYIDAGATATDDKDGDITNTIETFSTVDTDKEGIYVVVYSVSDKAGNSSIKIRTVQVYDVENIKEDKTKPIITLNGDANITIRLGDSYIDEGATATDDRDGDITNTIETFSTVDTDKEGIYVVVYSVNDKAGNSSMKIRTVTVERDFSTQWWVYDNTPPIAMITKLDLDDKKNIVLFESAGVDNGFILGNWEGKKGAWNDTEHTTIQWNMKFNDKYNVYVRVMTTHGARYISYNTSDTNRGLVKTKYNTYIYLGLGVNSADEEWHTITRDLNADLHTAEPDNNVTAINAILVRGSGMFGDIKRL
jgi:hypothetical protein